MYSTTQPPQTLDNPTLPNRPSMEAMYPPVPVDLLLREEWQERFREYFLDSGEFDHDPFQVLTHTERPFTKCVSVCLFKRNVDNRRPNEFPVNDASWHSKYWTGLQKLVGELRFFGGWKLRIYVEKDLWDLACQEFAHHRQVELYRMAVNSVGANPGSMWRFMALADRSLDCVLSTDIDEPLADKVDSIRSFEMDSGAAIGRLGNFSAGRHYLIDPPHSAAKNYVPMIGSRVMSHPRKLDFDLVAAMRGFMAYRRYHSLSDRPWAYAKNEALSIYNQAIGSHLYGWGSHWYSYCFDERFLKHVMYYHFASKGQLHTWAQSIPPWEMEPEGLSDAEYVQSYGNTTVCPHTAVRFAPLNLTPEALRIAFLIEEHRWLFDSLLQLMRRHCDRGVCGNLFFHNIEEPYFLQLVPKQLNLFKAAQAATKVLEIGFNAGHSAALMLLANPNLQIRAFDTCGLAYTKPCLNFLNAVFGDKITLIEGSSQKTVPADKQGGYDLIHIDGDHTYAAVAADLTHALPKCKPNAIVIMDDHEASNEVAQATSERTELFATGDYTLHQVFPGSSHAIFHYCPSNEAGLAGRA